MMTEMLDGRAIATRSQLRALLSLARQISPTNAKLIVGEIKGHRATYLLLRYYDTNVESASLSALRPAQIRDKLTQLAAALASVEALIKQLDGQSAFELAFAYSEPLPIKYRESGSVGGDALSISRMKVRATQAAGGQPRGGGAPGWSSIKVFARSLADLHASITGVSFAIGRPEKDSGGAVVFKGPSSWVAAVLRLFEPSITDATLLSTFKHIQSEIKKAKGRQAVP